jgi:hypothetical protein
MCLVRDYYISFYSENKKRDIFAMAFFIQVIYSYCCENCVVLCTIIYTKPCFCQQIFLEYLRHLNLYHGHCHILLLGVLDRFCGLVVKVPGLIPGVTRFSEK